MSNSRVPAGLVVHDADLDGAQLDIPIDAARGVVVGVAPCAGRHRDVEVIDARGGAVLPGLHDHHLHLLAMAAARRSLAAGPPHVTDAAGLTAALRRAAQAQLAPGWLRAVGYHESVAGDIDVAWLDRVVPDRPVRVQHRSGACWIVNSVAARRVGLQRAAADGLRGVERDAHGEPTGRLFGLDDWLAGRLDDPAPDLSETLRDLTSYGITGVTDATPIVDPQRLETLDALVRQSGSNLRVVVTGAPTLPADAAPGRQRGPAKIVVANHELPSLDDLVGAMRAAHGERRTVAVHCVTRHALLLALAAWDEAGAHAGDRIEHGAVIPLEAVPRIAAHGLCVVTQPVLVRERGDQYLADVDPADRGDLWRCRSLLDGGVAVAGSSDAPFGSPDPWTAIGAAVERRTASGAELGPGERLDARSAIDRYLAPLDRPGGPPRRIVPGAPADLCLLDGSLAEMAASWDHRLVARTIIAGRDVTER